MQQWPLYVYQVPQYSDFTFEVTKLYGSDYLVKSVKINGVEMLDAMTDEDKKGRW